MDSFPRPSHADFTYQEKYGIRASSGGGRSSARETIARVAAGAIAEKCLSLTYGVEIIAFVSSVGSEHIFPAVHTRSTVDPEFLRLIETVTRQQVDDNQPVRCPEPKAVCPGLHHLSLRFCFSRMSNDLTAIPFPFYIQYVQDCFEKLTVICNVGRAYGYKDCRTSRKEG